MFTAAQTELGKSEEWFWETEPRLLLLMLSEKKRIEIEKSRLLAHLINGGTVNEPGDELVPGIDYPADQSAISALEAFG